MKHLPPLALLAVSPLALRADDGVRPVGAAGQPLNLDFETGDLRDWTATGTAFAGQPVKGDTVAARRPGSHSRHQGQFWIGGFEKGGDKGTGTLTSVPFKVTHPWASFLVGGGRQDDVFVELVRVDTGKTFFRSTGTDNEDLRRATVDLRQLQGKDMFIRLVDQNTGGWGHLNFDDFRFHAEKPAGPAVAAAEPPVKADDYRYAGQPPLEAAKHMTVPPGFSVSLFAGEPDLHQPIGFCFDDRGRLWVAEAYVYPKRLPFPGPLLPEAERKNGDKILIFEDTDGDGKFDKRTVFLEGLNLVSGLEYGFGGLWVGAAPYLMFIPIDASGDKPAGEPKVLLDGWGMEDTHETLNSFVWGPDGWLYGCHGVFTHSRVGKPGTPNKDRQPINAGIWRYHPTKHEFEVFCHGTSNPWGLDYNAVGDFFIEACVIPHLWHMVPGGRYHRQAGSHFNPFTYDDIQTIAKHRHYVGNNPHGGNNRSDAVGGGHAHSGLVCYQGGAWPKEYHGKLLMGNIHGHRINVDAVTPKGSSYEGDRNPDFLLSHDKHFILVSIQAGPDGNLFFCDWSDKQVCHRNEVEIWDRTNGRIFKVSHKDAKPVVNFDLAKKSDAELVALQTSGNEWMVRHSRRLLQERGKASAETHAGVTKLVGSADPGVRLRGLWLGHATGLDVDYAKRITGDADEHVRGWAVRLGGTELVKAAADPSPVVRREVASALLRKPDPTALAVLLARPVDPADLVLPHLLWYCLEPQGQDRSGEHLSQALKLAASSPTPDLLAKMARRVGANGSPAAIAALTTGLAEANSSAHELAYLHGLEEAVKGKRQVNPPAGWPMVAAKLAVSKSNDVRQAARGLALRFGDAAAADELITVAADPKAPTATRQAALAAILEVGHNRTGGLLKSLLGDPAMRAAAIRGLARSGDDVAPTALLAVYPSLSSAEKRDAIATLASRAKYATALLAAVEAKTVPASDIPAETVRQLRNLNDEGVTKQLAAVWGTVRETPAARKQLIAQWGKRLSPDALAMADLGAGRAVFAKVCQQCHTLYGVGGKVGPEITGANRSDMNYLLENIFDPSAVIPKEYAATRIALADGRVVTGIVKEETAQTLTVVTANETVTLAVKDIDGRTPSDQSMMPDDLTGPLKPTEVRDLFAYLKHTSQVPQLADADSAKTLFNGTDLTGWVGDPALWSVQNGEIVGKTATGLKRNAFLVSSLDVTDFKLSFQVKLTPDAGNSGVQFRSRPIDGGEMKGPQADIGKGWWGKLYEENGRELLEKAGGEQYVKPGEWNEYVIEAVGGDVKLTINGHVVADRKGDAELSRRGQFGLQLHSGGPTEVRFKGLKLELHPPSR